jgi:AAA domain
MTMRVLSLADREREPKGTSIVLVGPSGIGKTFQISTLDPARTLLIDVDRGAQPLRNIPLDIVRPDGYPEIADLFSVIGGPNASLPATSLYSESHHERVKGLIDVDRYDTFVFDSISQIGRESYRYAEAYPESPPRGGGKDTRATYGQHARQLIRGLQQVQRGAPNRVIIMTAVLESVNDNLNRSEWRIQLQGEQSSRELPSIVDQIICLQRVSFGDGKPPARAFICQPDNPLNYSFTKDRSGALDPVEEPHLGRLIAKITSPTTQ